MRTITPSHILFLNSNYVHLLTYANNEYTAHIVKLSDEQYSELYRWVDTNGIGEKEFVFDNVTIHLVHNHEHPLRVAETRFETARMTKRLGSSVSSET